MLYFSLKYVTELREFRQFKEFGVVTQGTVIDRWDRTYTDMDDFEHTSFRITYVFTVGKSRYQKTENVHKLTYDSLMPGDSVDIVYLADSPGVSNIEIDLSAPNPVVMPAIVFSVSVVFPLLVLLVSRVQISRLGSGLGSLVSRVQISRFGSGLGSLVSRGEKWLKLQAEKIAVRLGKPKIITILGVVGLATVVLGLLMLLIPGQLGSTPGSSVLCALFPVPLVTGGGMLLLAVFLSREDD